jgi:TldD protein
MKKIEHSRYIVSVKPVLKKLLDSVLAKYPYASILAVDSMGNMYSSSKAGVSIGEVDRYSNCGFVIKAYDGNAYGEYSFNVFSEEMIPEIVKKLDEAMELKKVAKGELSLCEYKRMTDEPCVFSDSSEYEIAPWEMGDEKITERLTSLKNAMFAIDKRIINAGARINYQKYTKLFLSKNKDMIQSNMWVEAYLTVVAKEGDKVRDNYYPFSGLCGFEIMDEMEKGVKAACDVAIEYLSAEPMIPGTYTCVCNPHVTGMIVHEAFGHGVEMDMFVKDRALAKNYIGKRVASDLVTMHDSGNAVAQTGTYFFDDEGVLAKDTVIIEKGILKAGMSDAQSAMYLGTEPTGNGKRESYKRKAYTRMTNTYFEPGNSTVEEMIASVDYGFLLENPSSGMEDPKNWGIQMMVDMAREIKNGKLTGKVFSPCILSGYVPELLESISMMSNTFELGGSGACGKGYKELVKVSDGGPYIKAQIRLG